RPAPEEEERREGRKSGRTLARPPLEHRDQRRGLDFVRTMLSPVHLIRKPNRDLFSRRGKTRRPGEPGALRGALTMAVSLEAERTGASAVGERGGLAGGGRRLDPGEVAVAADQAAAQLDRLVPGQDLAVDVEGRAARRHLEQRGLAPVEDDR